MRRWLTRSLGLASLALWLALGIGLAAAVQAARPTTVQVEATVPIDQASSRTARNRAFQTALVEAVLEVAREQLDRPLVGDEEERLREVLAPAASAAVLTYRIESGSGPRPVRGGGRGGGEEYALGLVATIDAEHVASILRQVGWIETKSERPSVVFVTRADPDDRPPAVAGLLASFESRLEDRLRQEGFVVIEPALRARDTASPDDALAMARSLGAEVAIDMLVSWRSHRVGSAAGGGSIQVRLRALRTQDGTELASSRFGAPGYHTRVEEAQALALESVEPQVADNLALQLGRNWRRLARDGGPLELVLVDVRGLAQVDEVREALTGSLGAREAELWRLGPRSASLRVRGDLSPGALQDRLAGMAFEGFRLEPRSVGVEQLELLVVGTAVDGGPPASTR
jgi:hypothetical protein